LLRWDVRMLAAMVRRPRRLVAVDLPARLAAGAVMARLCVLTSLDAWTPLGISPLGISPLGFLSPLAAGAAMPLIAPRLARTGPCSDGAGATVWRASRAVPTGSAIGGRTAGAAMPVRLWGFHCRAGIALPRRAAQSPCCPRRGMHR
jgi:hypothetical protein